MEDNHHYVFAGKQYKNQEEVCENHNFSKGTFRSLARRGAITKVKN